MLYAISIPAAHCTPTILNDTFGSPSCCPVATHLKERGYSVLVGGMYLYFFPHTIPALVTNCDQATRVNCEGYMQELWNCAEAEEDFHFPIDLPAEIINAVPGESIWRRKL